MENDFVLKNKPSFAEWDEAIYTLAKQLRVAAKVLQKRGLAERALQLSDQARILDSIFIEAGKSFDALKDPSDMDMVEAIENRAIAKLMKMLPPLLESLPLLAKQVAAATGSSLSDGVYRGPATEFFLGSVGHPEEGIGDGTYK